MFPAYYTYRHFNVKDFGVFFIIGQFFRECDMLISNLEHAIRKRQYAIDVLRKDPTTSGLSKQSSKRYLILQHAYDIVNYKKELFQRTGHCSPLTPKWPRST